MLSFLVTFPKCFLCMWWCLETECSSYLYFSYQCISYYVSDTTISVSGYNPMFCKSTTTSNNNKHILNQVDVTDNVISSLYSWHTMLSNQVNTQSPYFLSIFLLLTTDNWLGQSQHQWFFIQSSSIRYVHTWLYILDFGTLSHRQDFLSTVGNKCRYLLSLELIVWNHFKKGKI